MFRGKRKYKDLFYFLIVIAGVIIINFLAEKYYFRVDMTSDNRYSMSESTKNIVGELEDDLFIEVYLKGDFPPAFERLKKSIKETLEQLKTYSDGKLNYRFFNPNSIDDKKERTSFFRKLIRKGLRPTNLHSKQKGGQTQKMVFPGAMIKYKDKETAVRLLKGSSKAKPRERINQSIEGLEYEFASAIRKITTNSKKTIAFTTGHGELNRLQTRGIKKLLSEYYKVKRIPFHDSTNISKYDAVVIARPTQPFNDQEKITLDQYVINGGNLFIFMDKIQITLDSLRKDGKAVTIPYRLNLNELLFNYGVRINPNLIKDLRCGAIPLIGGASRRGRQKTRRMPWQYYPLITNFSNHPAVKNLPMVITKFASSMDTVASEGIKITPLLYTSKYTQILPSPSEVSFKEVSKKPDPKKYRNGHQPLGFLLEGKFTSLYKHRLTPERKKKINFKIKNKPARIAVFSDGDIIKNNVNPQSGETYPLGYERYMQKQFANDDMLVNVFDYMLGEEGLVNIRAKDIKLRPLDKLKIRHERLKWQSINIGIPVFIVLLFGIIRFYVRKRKYEGGKRPR